MLHTYINLGLAVGEAALKMLRAAYAGNEADAKAALEEMRNVWQAGSDAIDQAIEDRNA